MNKTIKQIDKQIKKLQEEKAKLETKETPIYTKIPELKIEISQQIYNGKTYEEILKLVKEEEIADHNLLFKLRGLIDKYPQFKDFWVFCPNPDKISKDSGSVARFIANSDWAILSCDWNPSETYAALGVFLWRKTK